MGSETAFGGLAMWQTRGIGTNITKPIIARFSKKKNKLVGDIFRKNNRTLHKS